MLKLLLCWVKNFLSLYVLQAPVIHVQTSTLRRVQVFASHYTTNSFRHSWDLPSSSVSHHRDDGAQSPQEGSSTVSNMGTPQKCSGCAVGSSELNAEQLIDFAAAALHCPWLTESTAGFCLPVTLLTLHNGFAWTDEQCPCSVNSLGTVADSVKSVIFSFPYFTLQQLWHLIAKEFALRDF